MNITITQTTITTTTKIVRKTVSNNQVIGELKAVHADDLIYIANEAKRYDFNRQVDINWLRNILDPNGVNLVSVALGFHNGDFANIQHHRCSVLAKQNGKTEPTQFYLDVAVETFNRLFSVDRVTPVQVPYVESVYSEGVSNE